MSAQLDLKSTKPDRHECEGTVWTGSTWNRRMVQCDKTGKTERNGKWYCGTHDPVRVQAKRAERDAAWDRKAAAQSAKWRLDEAAPDLLAALKGLVQAEKDFLVESGCDWTDGITEAVKVAELAIKKAEGHS